MVAALDRSTGRAGGWSDAVVCWGVIGRTVAADTGIPPTARRPTPTPTSTAEPHGEPALNLDPRAIARLPVCLPVWEVDVFPAPIRVPGEDLEGILLVVDTGTGQVRIAAPIRRGEDIRPLLAAAMLKPVGAQAPARPRRMVCRDEATRARVAVAVAGLGVEAQRADDLAAMDDVIMSMMTALGGVAVDGPVMPGIDQDLPAWRAALQRLARVEPWASLRDSVTFRFEGGPTGLAGSVAIVIGLAGEQEGLVLFPSDEAYDRFVLGHHGATERIDACSLLLYPDHEVDGGDRRACAEAGLVLPGDRYPHLYQMRDGAMTLASEPDQRRVLAAIEAVCGLCEQSPFGPEVEPMRADVVTRHGAVVVRSRPSPSAARFQPLMARVRVECDHQVMLSRLVGSGPEQAQPKPAVILKMARRDAERVANELDRVDRVVITDTATTTIWKVGAGPDLRVLTELPRSGEPSAARQSDLAWVVVSAGGAKRAGLNPHDFVFARLVPVTEGERR